MRLNQRNVRSGFTLVEFMVIVVVLAILALLLLPAHTGNKASATRINCYNNLKQIGLAYRQWAIDHSDNFPTEVSITNGGAMEPVVSGNLALVFQMMSNELNTPRILYCQEDKKRIQATTFDLAVPAKGDHRGIPFLSNSNISYFVGLDANVSTPQMFLSGDDNLLIGGETAGNGVAIKGVAVKPGVLSLWTNTLVAWSEARHKKQGNVGLADGSVQGFSSSKLAEGLRNTGAITNRFMFP
jgi:prepilin-type processing-associated H-X9-DG protein